MEKSFPMSNIVTTQQIERQILLYRGQKVCLTSISQLSTG